MTDLECGTAFIQSENPVLGTTLGGVNYFDTEHYGPQSGWFCTPGPRGDYLSSERVYLFTHPGEGQNCQVYLESPCADLDLFTLRYNPYTSVPPSCPESGELNIQCEESTNPGPGFDEEIDHLYEQDQMMYMIIVDAPTPNEAWFD